MIKKDKFQCKKTSYKALENVSGGTSESDKSQKKKESFIEKLAARFNLKRCTRCNKFYRKPDALIGNSPYWTYCGKCIEKLKKEGHIFL